MSGIKLEVTANNSAPVLEDSFETLNENVGNIDYIVVDGTIVDIVSQTSPTTIYNRNHDDHGDKDDKTHIQQQSQQSHQQLQQHHQQYPPGLGHRHVLSLYLLV